MDTELGLLDRYAVWVYRRAIRSSFVAEKATTVFATQSTPAVTQQLTTVRRSDARNSIALSTVRQTKVSSLKFIHFRATEAFNQSFRQLMS